MAAPSHRKQNQKESRRPVQIGAALIGVVVVVTGMVLLGKNPSGNVEGTELISETPEPRGVGSTTSIISSTLPPNQSPEIASRLSLDSLIRSIVLIERNCDGEYATGSGSIVLDGTYVLTNQHVAPRDNCDYLVCLTETWTREPVCEAKGERVADDVENDLAVLRLINETGSVYQSNRDPIPISNIEVEINERVNLVGYPGIGDATITNVTGVVSGLTVIPSGGALQGEFLKTDAQSGRGVSGGAAFNSSGQYIGTPTGVSLDRESVESLGLVRPSRFAAALLERVRGD
jgi:S1-C subfamily serine protease